MKRHRSFECSHEGFTLIEIIVTLLLIGMTAAIMFPVMGNNLIRSPEPVARVNHQFLLVQEMEKWTGKYRNLIEGDSLDLPGFKADVENNANYLDSTNTYYINSFNSGAYSTQGTDKILKITLKIGDQTLYALFSDDAP